MDFGTARPGLKILLLHFLTESLGQWPQQSQPNSLNYVQREDDNVSVE